MFLFMKAQSKRVENPPAWQDVKVCKWACAWMRACVLYECVRVRLRVCMRMRMRVHDRMEVKGVREWLMYHLSNCTLCSTICAIVHECRDPGGL